MSRRADAKAAKKEADPVVSAAAKLEACLGTDDTPSDISSAGLAQAVGHARTRQRVLRAKRQRELKRSEELKKQSQRDLKQGSPAMQRKAEGMSRVQRGFGIQEGRDHLHNLFVKKEKSKPSPCAYDPDNASMITRPGSPTPILGAKLISPKSVTAHPGPAAYYPEQYKQPPTLEGGVFANKTLDRDMGSDRFFDLATKPHDGPSSVDTQPEHAAFPGSMKARAKNKQTVFHGRISKYDPKSDLEWHLYEQKTHPSVGDYELHGDSRRPDTRTGSHAPLGRFNKDANSGFLDVTVRSRRFVPGPGTHEIDRDDVVTSPKHQTAMCKGSAKTDTEWYAYSHNKEPGPADTQPKHGFSTKQKTLGKFSKSTGTYVDQHVAQVAKICEKACPGDTQYQDAAGNEHISKRLGGGFSKETKFFRSKPSDELAPPGPGAYDPLQYKQPATLEGGVFANKTRPRDSEADRFFDIHSPTRANTPTAVDTQPVHASFPGSMKAKTNEKETRFKGRMSKYDPKSDLEWHLYEQNTHPSVGDYELRGTRSIPDSRLGVKSPLGRFNKDANSGFLDVTIRGNRFIPGPGAHDIDRDETMKPTQKQIFNRANRTVPKAGMLREGLSQTI
jgi:hypothetical protein